MTTKHKLFGRFFSLAALFLIIFPLLVAATFIPLKARAADAPSLVTKATAYGAGRVIVSCADQGGVAWKTAFSGSDYSLAEVESGDIWEQTIRISPGSGAGMPAGYLTDPTDGITDCTNSGDVLQLFTAIGHKGSIGQFMVDAGIMTLSGDKAGYNLTDKSDGERASALKSKIESGFGINLSNPMPQDMAYAALRAAFDACKPTENTSGVVVKLVDSSGVIPDPPKTYAFGNDGNISAGYGLPNDGGNDGELACTTIAKSLNDTAAAYSTTVKAVLASGGSIGAPGQTTTATDASNSCESTSGALGWIMCPLTNTISGALNWVDTQLSSLLIVDRSKFTSPDLYSAWSKFRNIALVTLVPIMLVMVVGTAVGINAFDAYTVKKAMPRLVASVVFISLSWYVCVFFIDMFNVIGMGVLGIMTSPFNGVADSLSSLFSPGASSAFQIGAAGFILGAVTLNSTGLGIMLSWLGTAFLVMLVSYVVLIARQLIIIVAVLFAPVAILSWIFPSNNKLWKLWWETFSKLLIMYPMVMALLASGRIFAATANFSSGSGAEGWLVNPLIKMTAYVLPYAMIPFTFKAAGGIFSSLTGMVNDRSKGAFDRLRKGRQESTKRLGHEIKSGNFARGAPTGSFRGGLNKRLQTLSNQGYAGLAVKPSTRRARVESAMGEHSFEDALKKSEEIAGGRAFFASDDLMMAGIVGKGDETRTMDYYRKKGYSEDQARLNTQQVLRMRKAMGDEEFTLAALSKLPGTGTAYVGDEIGQWHRDIAEATHGNKSLQASIVASGKSGFRSAQRYEASEAGFGDHMSAIDDAAAGKDIKSISENIVERSYLGGGPAAVVGARNDKSAEIFARVINKRLDSAKSQLAQAVATPGVDPAYIESLQREVKQQEASIASVYDQSAQAKQIVGTVLADQVFNRKSQATVRIAMPDGTVQDRIIVSDKTQLQEVEGARGDNEFQEMRREIGLAGTDAQRAEAERRLRDGSLSGPGTSISSPTPGDPTGGFRPPPSS